MQSENIIPKRFYVDSKYIVQESYSEFDSLAKSLQEIPEISEEAYFGRLPIVEIIIKRFERIHDSLRKRINETIDDKTRDYIRNQLEEIEDQSARHFNVESVTINIITDHASIDSIPVSAGKIDLSKYKNMSAKDAMAEYSRIDVSKSGVKYIHKEGHHIIVTVGVGLLAAEQLKPEHITALFFHEIGHSFIQYKTGWNIGTQKLLYNIDLAMRTGFTVFTLVNSLFNIKKGLNDPHMKKLYNDAKENAKFEKDFGEKPMSIFHIWLQWIELNLKKNDTVLKSVTAGIFRSILILTSAIRGFIENIQDFWGYMFNDNAKESEKIVKARDQLLAGSFIIGKHEDLTLALRVCIMQFIQIFNIAFQIIIFGFPMYAINTALRSLLFPSVWVGKKQEYASDEIAIAYGLAPQVSEAFKLFRDVNLNKDFQTNGIFKLTNKIPVLNVIVQMPAMMLVAIENQATGHPSDRARIHNLYKQLQKELDSTPINSTLRRALLDDLNKVASTYNDYVDPKINAEENNHARAFVYFFARFISGFYKNEKTKSPKPPNKMILKLQSIKTWATSFDIKKLFGINSDSESVVLDSLEGKNVLATESYIDALDGEITYESVFSDDVYAKINAITFESYVGKRPIVERSINHIKDIRALFPDKSGTIASENKPKIRDILSAWQTEIANEFNVEESCIGLENIYNAFAYPMSIGNSAQFKAANAVKIIESPTGYKFEKKENLFIIMVLGIRLLTDKKLTDETIAAVMFHEIGHGFQQYKNQSIKKQRRDAITFSMIGLIKEFIYSVGSFQITNSIKTAFQIVTNVFMRFGFGKDRNKYIAETLKGTTVAIDKTKFSDGIAKPGSSDGPSYNPITWMLVLLQHLLGNIVAAIPIPGVSSFITTIIYDPLFLFDLAIRGLYFQRRHRDEYFADAFAAQYGLGSEMSEFEYKLYEMEQDKICEIPIIKIAVQFNMLGTVSMLTALDDHPTNRQRIKAIYESLNKELAENKTLTPELRDSLQKDIDAVQKNYNDLISPKENIKNGRIGAGLVWFAMAIFVKLKSTAKNVAEFMSPIAVSKTQLAKTAFTTFAEKKKIRDMIGDDISIAKAEADEIAVT
jgi:Zn-dependent protease with chaperone function